MPLLLLLPLAPPGLTSSLKAATKARVLPSTSSPSVHWSSRCVTSRDRGWPIACAGQWREVEGGRQGWAAKGWTAGHPSWQRLQAILAQQRTQPWLLHRTGTQQGRAPHAAGAACLGGAAGRALQQVVHRGGGGHAGGLADHHKLGGVCHDAVLQGAGAAGTARAPRPSQRKLREGAGTWRRSVLAPRQSAARAQACLARRQAVTRYVFPATQPQSHPGPACLFEFQVHGTPGERATQACDPEPLRPSRHRPTTPTCQATEWATGKRLGWRWTRTYEWRGTTASSVIRCGVRACDCAAARQIRVTGGGGGRHVGMQPRLFMQAARSGKADTKDL